MEIKRILFATDFSAMTSRVVPYVADMARRYSAKLYVVHVIQDIEKITEWYAPKVNMDELHKTMEAKASKELEKYVKEFGDYKDLENRLLKGIPHEEILKFKRDNRIDLIVLGTTGSITDKIMKESRRPVLVVAPREEMAESKDPRLCSGGEIRL
jgi:nucleotide-binding universal stress UspA family protein